MRVKSKSFLMAILLTAAFISIAAGQSIITHTALDGSIPPAAAPGAPAGSYPLSGFERINLYNGHLSLAIPMLTVGGRGEAGYTMFLSVEPPRRAIQVQTTQVGESQWGHNASVNSEWIYELLPRYSPGMVKIKQSAWNFLPCGIWGNTFRYVIFVAPDGTEHGLYSAPPTNPGGYGCGTGDVVNRGRTFVSWDGAGMTFVSSEDIVDQNSADNDSEELFDANGTLYLPNGIKYDVDAGRITKIRDRHGNFVSISYLVAENHRTVYPSVITDSLGRSINISYNQGCSGYTDCVSDVITFSGAGGNPRTLTVKKTFYEHLLTSAGEASVSLFPEISNHTASDDNRIAPAELVLPNGRTYQFTYNRYGEIGKVVLPTGGAIEYDHWSGLEPGIGVYASGQVLSPLTESQVFTSSPTPPWVPFIYRRLSERRVLASDGGAVVERSQYPRAESLTGSPIFWPSTSLVMFVAVNYGSPGATFFQVLRGISNPISDQHYFYSVGAVEPTDGTGGGPANNLLRNAISPGNFSPFPDIWVGTEYKTQTGGIRTEERLFGWFGATTLPRGVHPWLIKTSLDGVEHSEVLKYDVFENVTDRFEFDYGATPQVTQYPPPDEALSGYLRKTELVYRGGSEFTDAPGPYLRNLVQWQRVYASGDVKKAETEFEHDVYSGAGRDPLETHGAVTGFEPPGASEKRGNVTAIRRWLAEEGRYLETVQSWDELGNRTKVKEPKGTTTTYTFGSGCAFAFPSEVLNALGHRIRFDYDCSLGRPNSVQTEVSSNVFVATGYQYDDALDRLTGVTLPSGGSKGFEYDDANRKITTTTAQNSCGVASITSREFFDTLGRPVRSEVDSGDSTVDIVEREYDDHGRQWKISNPYRSGSPVWTTTTFDALNRPLVVTHEADGSQEQTSYTGNETMILDPKLNQRRLAADGLGRIRIVTEFGDAQYGVTYDYNVLDNLVAVTQGDRPQRVFSYDSLGRLLSANNPESGLIAYTMTTTEIRCSGPTEGRRSVGEIGTEPRVTHRAWDTMR